MPKPLRIATTVLPGGKIRLQATRLGELREGNKLEHWLMYGTSFNDEWLRSAPLSNSATGRELQPVRAVRSS